MFLLLDIFYLLLLLVASPYLLVKWLRTGRLRTRLQGFFPVYEREPQPTVWFHGVSVGEVHLLRTLVAAYQSRHPGQAIVISSTTETGLTEARKTFAGCTVVRFPFDFSWNCQAAIRQLKPKLIVLAESELWPNFLDAAHRARVPVVVVNGRMSPRSFARQLRFQALLRVLLYKHVTKFAMQTTDYAERLRRLGVPAEKITVTGSVKYDGVLSAGHEGKAKQLRTLLALDDSAQVFVAGSTHAPEEELVLRIFVKLRQRFPRLKLILVPRSADRFHEVFTLVTSAPFALECVRRSTLSSPCHHTPTVTLLDTMGELAAAWSLATVGLTGGSFDGTRGGQSMIEPAGFGVPVVFGEHIWNFRDAAENLVACRGAAMVKDEAEAELVLHIWLNDPSAHALASQEARAYVRSQQGAVRRTLDELSAL